MSKRKKIKDPYAEREASKYENPIPSREYILEYLQERGKPADHTAICKDLGLQGEEQRQALERRLRAMERDGQLISNRKGEYGLIDKMNLIRGRVSGHKDGFGFVIPDDGSDDLFLSARQMRRVFDGDKVLARVSGIDHRGRREGSIVEVLEAKTQYVVGRFFIERDIAFVVPDNKRITQDIIIPQGELSTARHGQIVTVEIISQPTSYSRPIGKITEVLGDHMAPGMEVDIAIRSRKLPHLWPDAVAHETAALSSAVPPAAIAERIDLRDLPFVTIDGEDARDFDDAVYCEAKPRGGWRLLVAIADVSHYVQPDTALDTEAQARGNSVYFPGQVIPMLPEILSNGLCSLNPLVDRLCMVCEMSVSATGKLTRSLFYPAVMHSKARLTYTAVNGLIKGDSRGLRQSHPELAPHIEELYRLFKVLHASRAARGAIEFETTETKVVFGTGRKIEQIVPVQRNDAHRLIEECMLLANVAAANYLLKNKIPALYRIHPAPKEDKLNDLRSFLHEFGLELRGGKAPQPADYAHLLKRIQGRPDTELIQTVMLRSLNQAVYSPENAEHFGLAFNAYTHFTSPIRRYPDLLVHRAIRHLVSGGKAANFHYTNAQMTALGEHCSMTERRADEATREAMDWLKCEYMQDKVGEEFEGVISSVVAFGIFVVLTSVYVEGLVHVSSLASDYYRFDPVRHQLLGERSGNSYRLGDTVRVRVARVSLESKQVDFELITPLSMGAVKKKGAKKAKTAKRAAKRTQHPSKSPRHKKSGTGMKRTRKRER